MNCRVTVDGRVFNFDLVEVEPGKYVGTLQEDSNVLFHLVGEPGTPMSRVLAGATEAVVKVLGKYLEVLCTRR